MVLLETEDVFSEKRRIIDHWQRELVAETHEGSFSGSYESSYKSDASRHQVVDTRLDIRL